MYTHKAQLQSTCCSPKPTPGSAKVLQQQWLARSLSKSWWKLQSYCGKIAIKEPRCIGVRKVFIWGPPSLPLPAGPWALYLPPSFWFFLLLLLFSFALEITLCTISYGWTLLIHLHACEAVSTHFVLRIFYLEFPSVLPLMLPQVTKDCN